ncbi:type I restriction endonuclease subunit R [Actinomadura spongiicola]|uniref:Type I restriction endonuclease subunit R n=1 Tax=Actinomadura spongiicola TaxID=2303421 RepID=A0A372GI92_9ACTN|nr:DEAD/DEAH box helicase family protein [Actinomadura spongiicola]RFS84829.1 type I restriction endonuclease subunit R [Actinomadura spongiicola]
MGAKVYGERTFEDAVESALIAHGWAPGEPPNYNRELALDTAELAVFLGRTQAREWERLRDAHGEDPARSFARLVAKEIDARGALDVLRTGVKDKGIRFRLASFRPAHTLAAGALDDYNANRLTVTRQLHYSAEEPANSVDLAFFVNGIPVASAELKNPATGQTVADAKKQYRDRDPKALFFARRTLVHFAVDTDLVFLTTRLAGSGTRFLPFNQGSNGPGKSGSAGNPSGGETGYRTSYLWEQVLQRDAFLELLQQYLHVEDADAKAGKAPSFKPFAAHTQPLIFPRFHQWHAVKELIADAREKGAGENYLIEHSAGSGKSNTIAWLAHRLSTLHDLRNEPVFDKVIVLTDRLVLDKQLQDTIYQFEQVQGVVERIEKDSAQLAEALTGARARIVITTQQKFPFVLDKVRDLAKRKYAIIVDEAHSSQGGEDNAALKRALGSRTVDEYGDPLTSAALARGRQPNLSVFAFTATPKKKTLDLFGRYNSEKGKNEPVHVYSMRQAIDEGFILDVLANYVTYDTFFKLSEAAADEAERMVDPRKAKAQVVRRAIWSEASSALRAKIIVDHFREHTAPRIGGRAKAMVVTPLRADALQLYQAIRTYVDERGFTDCGTLIAFSGALRLEDDGPEYTEAKLNGFPDRELPARFAYTKADDKRAGVVPKQEYRILVAAEKYQTGFDQPLLTTMYVAKPLADVAAVQTLSRLNRTHPGKAQEDLFVMDFANRAEDILEAFQPFYETTISEPTDPDLLYTMEREVHAYRLIAESEMRRFFEALTAERAKAVDERELIKAHGKLYRWLEPAVDRFVALTAEEPDKAEAFRGALLGFVRSYAWLSQVIGYNDDDLELLYQYGRFLLNKLPPRGQEAAVDVGEVEPSHLRIEKRDQAALRLRTDGDQEVSGLLGGATGPPADPDELSLAELIDRINDEYGASLSSADKIIVGQFALAIAEDPQLAAIALNNSREVFEREVDKDADRIMIDQAASNDELLVRYFDDENVNRLFKQVAKEQAYAMIRRPVRREAERRAAVQRAAEIRRTRPSRPE